MTVVSLRGVEKRFRVGFSWTKTVHALQGLDLSIEPGEILGFLGPNGAGKTTTLKLLLGLLSPSAGEIEVFGQPPGPQVRSKIGFLPENPYYYGYLSVLELFDLAGRLYRIPAEVRRQRAHHWVERVGLGHATDRPLHRYSKGMLQRAGLGFAMMGDPSLIILDEPQSGLDPIGRRDVSDIILSLKEAGKTVFFSSHILPDVEQLCDRVALIVEGRLRACGPLRELLGSQDQLIDVVLEGDTSGVPERWAEGRIFEDGAQSRFRCPDQGSADALLKWANDEGLRVREVQPHGRSLEDLFLQEAAP